MNTVPRAAGATRCARCGGPMFCGRDDPHGCWCARLPPLPAAELVGDQGCLCEQCLREALPQPDVNG